MTRVRVTLDFISSVSYVVDVENPTDLDQIKKVMLQKDADDWEYDPNFYEQLGDSIKYAIEKMDMNNIETVEDSENVPEEI